MSKKNKVEQKVALNIGPYKLSLQKIREEQRVTTESVKRSGREQSKAYEENVEKIKKKNLDLSRSLKDVSKEFGKNLWKGTVITGGGAMVAGLKSQYEMAAKSVLTLDQGLSRLSSRYDLSAEKAKKLRKELQTLGTQTGVSGGLLAEGAEELMSANSKREAIGIGSVGQFSAMGGGDPKEVARFVIDYLKGSGQKLTEDSVKDLLTSVSSINRGGDLSLEDSLRALTMDPASKAKLNLSNKENAALVAAASGVGQDRGISISGLNAVLKKSVGGFGEGAALSGILGVKGGFMTDGKFDVSKLEEASNHLNKQGLGKADFTKLLESSGLSGDEAEGLYSILKDFDQFNNSFKKVLKDQKTLDQSFSESTDNLKDSFARMSERIAKASTEVISPLGSLAKDVLDGNFSNALKNAPSAIGESAQGAWDNKGTVALGIGAVAMTGALATKIAGIMGLGTAKDTAKGLAVQAATNGKVQPVMVVNISDLANAIGSTGAGMDLAKKVAGGGAMAAIGAKISAIMTAAKTTIAMGGMSVGGASVGALAGTAAIGGALGYGAGTLIDKYGPTMNMKTADGFEGGLIESVFFKLDKLLGGDGAKNIEKASKVQFEIIDNGERFTARPKAGDLRRNNIGG